MMLLSLAIGACAYITDEEHALRLSQAEVEVTLQVVHPMNQLLPVATDSFVVTVEGGENDGVSAVPTWDADEAVLAVRVPALAGAALRVDAEGSGGPWTGRTALLTSSDTTLEAPIYLTVADSVGWLSPLDHGSYAAGLVALGEGRFLLVGGYESGRAGELRGTDEIALLDLGSPAERPAFEAFGSLPEVSDAVGNLQRSRGMAAVGLLDSRGPTIVVAGGAAASPYQHAPTVTGAVSVLRDGVWETAGPLACPRAGAASVIVAPAMIFLWGGWAGIEDDDLLSWCTSIEWLDLAAGQSDSTKDLPADLGELGAAGASLGDDGVLFCGGMLVDAGETTMSPRSGCVRMSLGGALSAAAELPEPLAGFAMTRLADGRVLASGGTNADVVDALAEGTATAVNSAYLYDPETDRWAEAGPMFQPRAGHRLVALPNGDALVVGGATTWSPLDHFELASSCIERFSGEIGSFTPTDCTWSDDAGDIPYRAWLPEVAVDDDHGVLIVGGLEEDGASSPVSLYVP